MKRYEFRAQKVLRVRRLQEDIARAGVAAARRDEAVAAEAAAASQQRYHELAAPAAGPTSAGAFLALRDQAGFRAQSVVNAQVRHSGAQVATAGALNVWHGAHRAVEGLERLDERRRGEYDIESRRAEDIQVDETVVARLRSGS